MTPSPTDLFGQHPEDRVEYAVDPDLGKELFQLVRPYRDAGQMGFLPLPAYVAAVSQRRVLIARRGPTLWGFVFFKPPTNDKPYRVQQIAVKEDAPPGVGRRLMNSVFAIVLSQHQRELTLEVHADNTRAVKFYEDLGMYVCGRAKHGSVVMRKDLVPQFHVRRTS